MEAVLDTPLGHCLTRRRSARLEMLAYCECDRIDVIPWAPLAASVLAPWQSRLSDPTLPMVSYARKITQWPTSSSPTGVRMARISPARDGIPEPRGRVMWYGKTKPEIVSTTHVNITLSTIEVTHLMKREQSLNQVVVQA